MARVLYGKTVLVAIEQLIDSTAASDKQQAFALTDAIAEAVGELEQTPLRGMSLPGGLRQLRIPHAGRLYLVLYRHLPVEDRVEVLLLDRLAPAALNDNGSVMIRRSQ